jgi:hypothetical protein
MICLTSSKSQRNRRWPYPTALLDLLRTLSEQAQDDQGVLDVGQLIDLIDIEKGSLSTKRRQGQKVDVTIKLAIDILQIV